LIAAIASKAIAALRLSHLVAFAPFAIFGTLLVMALAAIWLCVAFRTAMAAWRGSFFLVPNLVREDYVI
jgi:hypothetical protein